MRDGDKRNLISDKHWDSDGNGNLSRQFQGEKKFGQARALIADESTGLKEGKDFQVDEASRTIKIDEDNLKKVREAHGVDKGRRGLRREQNERGEDGRGF